MIKTASQIADYVLEKAAVSPVMAQRALSNASAKLVAAKASDQKILELFQKFIRTNARSQGATRAEMPATVKELRDQFAYMKSLGAMK